MPLDERHCRLSKEELHQLGEACIAELRQITDPTPGAVFAPFSRRPTVEGLIAEITFRTPEGIHYIINYQDYGQRKGKNGLSIDEMILQ